MHQALQVSAVLGEADAPTRVAATEQARGAGAALGLALAGVQESPSRAIPNWRKGCRETVVPSVERV